MNAIGPMLSMATNITKKMSLEFSESVRVPYPESLHDMAEQHGDIAQSGPKRMLTGNEQTASAQV